MLGGSHGRYGSDTASTDTIEETLDQAEDVTGLDSDVFDDITVDPSLPDNVPAATRLYDDPVYGSHAEFVANDSFFYLPEDQQLVTAAHEILEGTQVKKDLGEEFQEKFGVSDELAELLSEYQQSAPNDLREGMTQALTNRLVPGGERKGRYFYPYETRRFEDTLDELGLDLDEDLGIDEELVAEYVMEPDVYGETAVYEGPSRYDTDRTFTYDELFDDTYLDEPEAATPDYLEEMQEYLDALGDVVDADYEVVVEQSYTFSDAAS